MRNIGIVIHRSTNVESDRFLISSGDVDRAFDVELDPYNVESYC